MRLLSPPRVLAVCLGLALSVLVGCSARDRGVGALPIPPDPVPVVDAGPAMNPVVACTPDNIFCNPPMEPPPASPSCQNAMINVQPVGVNVMIAVDGSKAMANHWEILQNGIKKMIEQNLTLNFGAHLFYADVADLDMALENVNFCGKTINKVLDVGPDQQTKILPYLGPAPPGPGADFFSFRPVVEPLNYYLENASKLTDPQSTNYLVFISNGQDNCFGTIFAQNADKLLTYEKIAVELQKRNVRIIPIGFDGATAERVAAPRFLDAGMLMTNFEALDRLAQFGGAGLKKALVAESSEELEAAIATVSQQVRTCRFAVPDVLDPAKNLNPFAIEFLVNGVAVPRDRTHQNGWDFANGNTSQAEMYGEPCTAIRAGKELNARALCNTEKVCGTAATKLTTKARAVQFVLDASASMLTCSDPDPLMCFPSPIGSDALVWWEVAVRSVGTTVVATVNDDVEFGLQYLPGRGTGLGSCEAAKMPEVPPKDGSEITVIRSALSTLPLGGTPLVATLEGLAQNPGRIADPGVSGALLIMSDGGNGCGDIPPAEAATRLGEAAKQLAMRGVKVFVIKLGSGNVPEEDAQLRAIAENGGAPQMGATPYLEAPSADKLAEVLATLSDSLANCQLELGPAPKDADSSKVNLYIDGAVIPFDAKNEKRDGWGWTDDAKRNMTMYGEACAHFKKSRATNIVVEYGCMPVPVLL
jgi:Mg-chelatase subunit ChlD